MSVADMYCDYCEREADVLVTCPDCKTVTCLVCRDAHLRDVERLFRDVYGPDFAALATWQAEGR